jgi:ElaA protein
MENKVLRPFQLTNCNLLKLRSEIFVVEQNCVYLDLDGKDKLAASFAEFEGKVVAHARLIKPGISFDNASIGRVVVDANYRDRK